MVQDGFLHSSNILILPELAEKHVERGVPRQRPNVQQDAVLWVERARDPYSDTC